MARPTSPTVSRRELANTLRKMRLQARKTLEDAAAALEVSAATISRIETGVRVPRARDVKDLCEFYGLADPTRIAELTALVADAKESGWYETYTEVDDAYATFIGLEEAATAIDEFEATLIPSFLQTESYSRAFHKAGLNPGRKKPFTDHDIDKRIEVLAQRQNLLTTNPDLKFTAILDEAALIRIVGGPTVMQEQIAHLIRAADRSETHILILPLDRGAHPGQVGGFSILTLPQAQVSDVVYVDSSAGQLFLETTDQLVRYREIFHTLRETALTPAASLEALKSRINHY